MYMDEILTYAAAVIIILILIAGVMLLQKKVQRSESMEDQIAQDEFITSAYNTIKSILSSDTLLDQLRAYDAANGTQYEKVLRDSIVVIDSYMLNRSNNLVGYLMLSATTVPKLVEILRTVGLGKV